MCFARSEKGLQAICSLITANPTAELLPTIFDKTWRAGGLENGKATSASLLARDDSDPNFTTGQTVTMKKKHLQRKGKCKTMHWAAGGTGMGLECPARDW